jgi:hypothetical protein
MTTIKCIFYEYIVSLEEFPEAFYGFGTLPRHQKTGKDAET